MNLRELDYICAVARTRHFGKAAEACHVSQPTLSSQIIKLEQELGVTLFERIRGRVIVTKEGEAIIAAAERARQAANDIKSLAKGFGNPFTGQIKLGFIPTIGPFLLPHISRALLQAFPELEIIFIEETTDRLNARLRDGTLDMAILATGPEDNGLIDMPLYDERFYLALPKSTNFMHEGPVYLDEIKAETLLLLDEGHCLRDQALNVCSLNHHNQNIRATSLETLLSLVAAGHGATLLPTLAIKDDYIRALGVQICPIADENAYRRINLTTRKTYGNQVLVEGLAKLICAHLPTHDKPGLSCL